MKASKSPLSGSAREPSHKQNYDQEGKACTIGFPKTLFCSPQAELRPGRQSVCHLISRNTSLCSPQAELRPGRQSMYHWISRNTFLLPTSRITTRKAKHVPLDFPKHFSAPHKQNYDQEGWRFAAMWKKMAQLGRGDGGEGFW